MIAEDYDYFVRYIGLCGVFPDIPATVIHDVQYIALTPICKLLKIGSSGQMAKLKKRDWANGKVFYLLNDVTREIRRYYMIDPPTLQRWLDEINVNWLKPECRDIHELLQYEAAKDLASLKPY